MAPELWMGKAGVQPMRCDVFALGKILRDIIPAAPYEAFEFGMQRRGRPAASGDAMAVLEMWERIATVRVTADWRD